MPRPYALHSEVRSWYVRGPIFASCRHNKYQSRRHEKTQGPYWFRNFESRLLYVLVRFVPCKVRGGGTVHGDRNTVWSRFSSVGITERRQVDSVIRIDSVIGPRSRWPITKAVSTVQPERRECQMSNPQYCNTPLTWQAKSLHSLYTRMSVDRRLCARDYRKRTFTHRPVKGHPNQSRRRS